MNIIHLLKQDVINIATFLKYNYEKEPITLITLIFICIIIILLFHYQFKRMSKPNYIIQKIGMKMNYVYKDTDYSYVFINKRNDGKIDITNEQGEKMFTQIEDALTMTEIFIKLKERT